MRVYIGVLSFVTWLSAAANPSDYQVKTPPLTTPWTYKAGTNPWPEYPRPQLQRSNWKSLNGIWSYGNASGLDAVNQPPNGSSLPEAVLIPSCLESGLSGIQAAPGSALYSWFSTNFTVPRSFGSEHVLLNFGAVDYEATVFVNGHRASFHRGGYFTFTVDVTSYLKAGDNELLVFVHDPTDSDDYVIPIGKQVIQPSHIFYTPCSGIWQSVWIEAAPANYIKRLDVDADMHGAVNVTVHSAHSSSSSVTVSLYQKARSDGHGSSTGYGGHNGHGSGKPLATHKGQANKAFVFSTTSPKLWSPDSPNLYDIVVTFGDDQVSSYTGFRTIEKGEVNGITRALLNGEPIFQFGTLDQGYWPDGIYTPPNREAMVYDLQVLKKLGFNMLRKHIKVENALFYQACDEMGLLVIQDMPALRPLQTRTYSNCTTAPILPNATQQVEFARQLGLMVDQLKNYPSIGTWIVYNEGWGQLLYPQLPEFGLTDMVKSLDPSRLVDSTSGWYDHGAGDYSDNHHYANPQCGSPFYSIQSSPYDSARIGFQGEFGGIGNNVSIEHLWNNAAAIATINQTYEIDQTLDAWNYRGHILLGELLGQIERYACSGGVWTQTTDVEGEVNGLLTYDRRILRTDVEQWQEDIENLYDAIKARSNSSVSMNANERRFLRFQ